jgi:hypothetical protein
MDKVCKCCIDNECECKGTSLISAIWPEPPVVVESAPSPLSDAARAVIAAMFGDVNRSGVSAPDAVWTEIQQAFPFELFENRPDAVTYDPEAGW